MFRAFPATLSDDQQPRVTIARAMRRRVGVQPSETGIFGAGDITVRPSLTLTTLRRFTMTTTVQCSCVAIEMRLTGTPLIQYICHCDDCQAVHGNAYSCSQYAALTPVCYPKEGSIQSFTFNAGMPRPP
jgi:hypothetical protein